MSKYHTPHKLYKELNGCKSREEMKSLLKFVNNKTLIENIIKIFSDKSYYDLSEKPDWNQIATTLLFLLYIICTVCDLIIESKRSTSKDYKKIKIIKIRASWREYKRNLKRSSSTRVSSVSRIGMGASASTTSSLAPTRRNSPKR